MCARWWLCLFLMMRGRWSTNDSKCSRLHYVFLLNSVARCSPRAGRLDCSSPLPCGPIQFHVVSKLSNTKPGRLVKSYRQSHILIITGPGSSSLPIESLSCQKYPSVIVRSGQYSIVPGSPKQWSSVL
jgi:hypothetical protein